MSDSILNPGSFVDLSPREKGLTLDGTDFEKFNAMTLRSRQELKKKNTVATYEEEKEKLWGESSKL